ncbi:MAG: MerR family transcriptional regulator [Alphaproteobacteria bacterium]|nr:MerR family transcriptional regulator [Alphaproteobacteria bacterium]
MSKAPDAFRTISEVSEQLDVPQHVLRFWEGKFAQVRPLKRAGGRRYYRPDDIDLLKGIRALLYNEGLTIKGVQKVLREQGAKHVAEVGRLGAKTARKTSEVAPLTEDAGQLPALLPIPSSEHVNLDVEEPSETLVAEQRERLEVVLQDLLRLSEMLKHRRKKTAAAE